MFKFDNDTIVWFAPFFMDHWFVLLYDQFVQKTYVVVCVHYYYYQDDNIYSLEELRLYFHFVCKDFVLVCFCWDYQIAQLFHALFLVTEDLLNIGIFMVGKEQNKEMVVDSYCKQWNGKWKQRIRFKRKTKKNKLWYSK